MRYTIAVDFDGVLHRYDTPWIDAETIPDPPVEGAIDWLCDIARKFKVVIFTTRGRELAGQNAVLAWLDAHGVDGDVLLELEVAAEKPPALVYIDDRAWRFEGPGKFPDAEQIHRALPWHKRLSLDEPRMLDREQIEKLAADVADRAAPVFAAAGWTWGAPDVAHVPDRDEIHAELLRLLTECPLEKSHSTGRFYVSRWMEDAAEQAEISLSVGSVSA